MQNERHGLRTSTKVILLTGIAMLIIGGVLLVVGVAMGGFQKLDGQTLFGKTININGNAEMASSMVEVDPFTSVDVTVIDSYVTFVDDENYYVESTYEAGMEPVVEVQDGTLVLVDGESLAGIAQADGPVSSAPESGSVDLTDGEGNRVRIGDGADGTSQLRIDGDDGTRITIDLSEEIDDQLEKIVKGGLSGDWNIDLGGMAGSSDSYVRPSFVIHCPLSEEFDTITLRENYGDMDLSGLKAKTLNVNTYNGYIYLSDFAAGTLAVYAPYSGDVTLVDGKAEELSVTMESADVNLQRVEVSGAAKILAEYSDMTMGGSTFGSLAVELQDGDITAENITVNTGTTVTSTYGDVEIGGKLLGSTRVTTEDGDIDVTIVGAESDYKYAINPGSGEAQVNGAPYRNRVDEKGNGKNTIQLDTEYGDIEIWFR